MKKIALSILIIFGLGLNAQNLKVGIKILKSHSMYWENGFSLKYSFKNFKPNQFYLGFDVISSRVGSAFRSNALKQESYLISPSWHFFSKKDYHIITKLNIGYFYADLEEDFFDELPHSAFLLSPDISFSYDLNFAPLSLNIGCGYYINFQNEGESPGTLQPLYYYFSVYYNLF